MAVSSYNQSATGAPSISAAAVNLMSIDDSTDNGYKSDGSSSSRSSSSSGGNNGSTSNNGISSSSSNLCSSGSGSSTASSILSFMGITSRPKPVEKLVQLVDAPPGTLFTSAENDLLLAVVMKYGDGTIKWKSVETDFNSKAAEEIKKGKILYKRQRSQMKDRYKTIKSSIKGNALIKIKQNV